jgi:hypothetical protein
MLENNNSESYISTHIVMNKGGDEQMTHMLIKKLIFALTHSVRWLQKGY